MSNESFIREVDEAVRQEEFKRLWNRYGLFVIAGAALIIAGVAGYKGWNYWQAQQAQDAGARFIGALILDEDGKAQDARAAFEEIAKDGPEGYRILSRFQLAAADAAAGEKTSAVEAYDALASDSAVGSVLQDYAKIRAATLLVDEASLQDMKKRLDSLAEGEGPYRNAARELLGLSAYRNNDMAEAARYYRRIMVDPEVTATMRQRAQMMLALTVEADKAPATN